MAAPIKFELECDLFSFSTTVLEQYSVSKSANWESQEIMNRSSPIINYASSASMEVSVSVQLVATDASKGAYEEVEGICEDFIGLTYPVKPGIEPPPLCRIWLGNILEAWWCVCSSANVSAQGPWAIDGGRAASMQASVDLSFTEVDPKNTPAKYWIGGGSTKYFPWRGVAT